MTPIIVASLILIHSVTQVCTPKVTGRVETLLDGRIELTRIFAGPTQIVEIRQNLDKDLAPRTARVTFPGKPETTMSFEAYAKLYPVPCKAIKAAKR